MLLLFSAALQVTGPMVSAPVSGQTLRGQVNITGRTDISNFVSAELAFAYASDSADNWFALQTLSQPVTDSILAVWDTTLISDGNYKLRLRVFSSDSSFQDVLVTDLHVRNYTMDTPTPTLEVTQAVQPTLPSSISTPLATVQAPTPIPRATPTSFPINPASLTAEEIYASLTRGVLIIVGLFIIFSILTRLRRP